MGSVTLSADQFIKLTPQKRLFDLQNTLENLIAANANFYKALASGDGHLMR